MDVRLPNGAVLRGVPDGATKSDVMQRAIAMGAAKASDFAAQAPPQSIEEQRAQVADGMTIQFGLADMRADTGIPMPQWMTEFLAGAGRRVADVATLGGAIPVGPERSPEADKLLDDSGAATLGGVATDIAALTMGGAGLKAAGAIPKVGGALVKAGQALQAPQSLAQAATAGGLYAGATTRGSAANRAQEALYGAVGGAGGTLAARRLGGALSPQVKPEARRLLSRGMRLTPGELFGGAVQRVEDGLSHTPFLGDMIVAAKRTSLEDFNRSVLDDVLKPLGMKISQGEPGRALVDRTHDVISAGYEALIPKLSARGDDMRFLSDIAKVSKYAADNLPEQMAGDLDRVIRANVLRHAEGGKEVGGRQLLDIQSWLSGELRNYRGQLTPNDRKVKYALTDTQEAVRRWIQRANPQEADALREVHRAFAKMAVIERASTHAGAKDGVFTAHHLVEAIKKESGRRYFSRGKAFGQRYAEAANNVLPSKVGDSGTAPRAWLTSIVSAMAGTGGAAFNPAIGPASIVPMALTAAYSDAGRAITTPMLTARPQASMFAGQLLRDVSPRLGMLAAAGSINVE